jgi:O-antigen/teichoic acid export membrane protein
MTSRRSGTTGLAAGSAVSGVLAYIVFAGTTRALGPDAAAPVSVLWSYWSFASAALTFPLQHWIAATVARHGEGAVRAALGRLVVVVLVCSVLAGAVAWLAREPLFHRDDVWFPVLVSLVTGGSALVGVARGGLTAQERFVQVGWSLAGENAVRCVAVLVLAAAGVTSPVAYGVCLVAGNVIGLVWPSALRFHRRQTSPATSPLAFLTGSGLGQLLAQVVLTGGPVLLALAGGTPGQVTAMFAALALFRAPYVLAMGLVSQLTGMLSRLVARRDHVAIRRIRNRILGGTTVLAAVAGAGAFVLGPAVIRLVFGQDLVFPPTESGIVAVACVLAVGNLVCSVLVMAQNRPAAIVRSWLVALTGAGAGFVLLAGLDAGARTTWAFVIAEGLAFVMLMRGQPRASA